MRNGDDLAQELGISTTALSQIVHGKGRYAEATRRRVLQRVGEVGYAPHAGARAARLRRFDAITMFHALASGIGSLHPTLIEGCAVEAARRGLRLIMESLPVTDAAEFERRSTMFAHRVCDGLLMNHELPPTAEARRLVALTGLPVLWLNLNLPEAAIRPDDAAAAATLVEALAAHGRRRLAQVDFGHDHSRPSAIAGAHYSVGMRTTALADAAGRHGVEMRLISGHRPPFAERVACLRASLAGAERPDGLICYGPTETLAALLALAACGLRPGREVGLVQFAYQAAVEGCPVSTALIPGRRMGELALAAVADAVDQGRSALPSILVPFTCALDATL